MYKTLWFFLALLFIGCSTPKPLPQTITGQKAKNVILLIGDGMGLSQVSSSFFFGAEKDPNFVRFPQIGLSRTTSSNRPITDSAAGAAAFASGIKTYNGAIGVNDKKQPVETIVERIAPRNIKTGLIATSSITHATPACFYAHVTNRGKADSIAGQLPTANVHFFAGGGLKYFNKRPDGRNVLEELKANGFVVDTSSIRSDISYSAKKKYGFLLSEDGMGAKVQGRDDFLPVSTKIALRYLSKNEEGFFLMVEGSQIDWEGHGTNVQGVVEEVLDFDKALGVALDFAERDGNTLVVVTADHETGGFALSPPLIRKQWYYDEVQGSFFEGSKSVPSAPHTATMVPVFAYGPGAEAFSGIYQNNEIFFKMLAATGW